MKFSCFYIMTEPEKMGYPYLESLTSTLKICDEVVVVLGREEEESENKILELSSRYNNKVKIIKTNSWPEKDWHYDTMRDHFRIGLESCTGDLCMKMDADFIFRDQHSTVVRQEILNYAARGHITYINLIHHYMDNRVSYRATMSADASGCYIINKKLLDKDQIKYRISNESGSNKPVFLHEEAEQSAEEHPKIIYGLLGDLSPRIIGNDPRKRKKAYHQFSNMILPINYSYTFCTREQIEKYWPRWFRARDLKFNDEPLYDYNNKEKSFKHFMEYYHNKKIPKECAPGQGRNIILKDSGELKTISDKAFTQNGMILTEWDAFQGKKVPKLFWAHESYPDVIRSRIINIEKDKWGYNNFEDLWQAYELEKKKTQEVKK